MDSTSSPTYFQISISASATAPHVVFAFSHATTADVRAELESILLSVPGVELVTLRRYSGIVEYAPHITTGAALADQIFDTLSIEEDLEYLSGLIFEMYDGLVEWEVELV